MREALAFRIAALTSFVGLAAGAYRTCSAEGDFYLLARQLTPQARERDQRVVCGQESPCRGGRDGLPRAFRSYTALSLSPPPAASLTLDRRGAKGLGNSLPRLLPHEAFVPRLGRRRNIVMANQAQTLRKAIENLINAKLHDALARPGGVDRLIAHRVSGVASWEIRNAEKHLEQTLAEIMESQDIEALAS